MSSFPPACGIGQGGGSLNVPDDHRFATTTERDAAIPSPKQGEQCTVQSNVPQYHLLQEYRVDKWVDITFIIQGPKGEKGSDGELAAYQQPDKKGFINESIVGVDFPFDANGSQYRANNVVVMVLKTDSLINGLNISVVGGDFTGDYNAIGPIFRDEHGEWAQGGKRNAYRINTGEDTYCVFDINLSSWVLIKTDTDHNHTGQQTGGEPINLYNDGQLPDSYGSYEITNTLDEIDSEYFEEVSAPITYHENNFVVDFGKHELAGIIFYK